MPFLAPFVPALIGAAAGVGTAVIAGGAARHAANSAEAAQKEADDKALAAQQGNLDRIAGLQQPYVNAGYSALDAIMSRYGLPSGGGAPTSPPAAPAGAPANNGAVTGRVDDTFIDPRATTAPAGGAPAPGAAPGSGADWSTYVSQNPDVAAEFEHLKSTPEGQAYLNAKGITDANGYGADHYAEFGKAENRALPMNPSTALGSGAPGAPSGQGPNYGTRPDAGPRPGYETPTYTRPDQPQWADRGSGPDAANYLGEGKFKADPGYAFRQSEALRGGNAAYGAKGLLKSGGAIKAAQDRSYNLADQSYNDWFNQASSRLAADRGQFNTNRQADFNIFNTNRQNLNANFDTDRQVGLTQFNNDRSFNNNNYDTDRDFANNNFNNDRGFTANRDDQRMNDLFDLTGIGTSAAGATGAAGTNYANSARNIYQNGANAAGDAAYARGSANAGVVGAIGGAAANIFSRYQPAPTYVGNPGGSAYGQPGAPSFVPPF